MRLALLVASACVTTPALAQDVASSQSAQTTAPLVGVDRPQPPSCGGAPNVAQINKIITIVRARFPQPAGFNAGLTAEIRKTCPRNAAAAYLVRTIAASDWAFAPSPYIRPGSWPMGTIACGPAASSADLNLLIGKIRPLYANPAQFNAAIGYIGKQPCVAGRATLFLFALIVDNGLTFR